MRTIMIMLALLVLSVPSAMSTELTDFDSFLQTREVIATLYFDMNAEDLSSAERERLASTVQQLRSAQKNGRMIRVEGFSSNEGDQEKNFILSFFRARSVADLIEAEGLASEVALTGYGDLRADSLDHARERRVEIASYVKPVGMKRVKVAKNKTSPVALSNNSAQIKNDVTEIESYQIDQAIRSRFDEKSGVAEQPDRLDNASQPNLSKTREQLLKEELERGYSLWRQSVAPAKPQEVTQVHTDDLNRNFTQYIKSVISGTSLGLTQAKKAADEELKRGYSQSAETIDPGTTPGLTQSKESDEELQRGYSQSDETSTPGATPGLTQSKTSVDDLQRGYSQLEEVIIPDSAPGVAMVVPVQAQAPVIDALMIEQSIMEKIGVKPTKPSGTVTQIDLKYR